jgi:hypothetical protein
MICSDSSMNSIASSKNGAVRSHIERLAAVVAAVCLTLLPLRAHASTLTADAPAAREKAAVIITQAVGVGALADRLGEIASDVVAESGAPVLSPAQSTRQLRATGGPDPLTCGTEPRCLGEVAAKLGVRWVIAVGIGRFGGMYGLELRLIDARGAAAPGSASGTWAEPGPDWETAMRDALTGMLPAALRKAPAGRLFVRANAPGELFVDGAPVATLPLAAPIELSAGAHSVELRGESGDAKANVEVPAGALAELELVLAPALVEAPPSRWMRTTKWVTGGGAVAVLAAAIGTNIAASSTMDDARTQKDAGKPFAGTREDALDQIGTSRVLYGVAAGLAVGAATLWLLDESAAAQP